MMGDIRMGDVVLLEMIISKYHKIAENNGIKASL